MVLKFPPHQTGIISKTKKKEGNKTVAYNGII